MNVNTKISRGLERLMVQREGARLEGLFGLAGLGTLASFGDLADVLAETGYRGGAQRVAKMRRAHDVMAARIRRALPIARDARAVMIATNGDLSGIFSKVGKALKKVAKVAVKLSPSHALIKKVAPKAALLSPSMMIASRISSSPKSAPKTQAQIDAAAAKKAAKAAAKQAKKDAKAAKKAAKAAAALQAANATALHPNAAAAAVLANQSGVNLSSPEAQQFAQDLVSSGGGGGGGGPAISSAAPQDAANDGTIFGMSPLVAAGAGALALGGIYLLTRKRRAA